MGGGAHTKFSEDVGGGPAHNEKWTQRDLRFCKNEGSKRSNDNEKGGQQDRKSRRKLVQIASKVSNDRFLCKNRPSLGQIIGGTKCDTDKQIFFSRKRWSIRSSWT